MSTYINRSLLNEILKYATLIGYMILLYFALPIAIAILCAYMFFPTIQFIHTKTKIPFILCVSIVTIGVFYSVYQVSFLLLQSILHSIPSLKGHIQSFIATNSDMLFLPFAFEKLIALMDTFFLYIVSLVQKLFNSLFEFFVFIVAFYFALFESRKNRLWFFIYIPQKYRETWKKYFIRAMSLFSRFLYVELQLILLTFVLLSIGFWLLQFQQPISKAALISIADILPFLGIGLFLLPIALYFFVTGQKLLAFALLLLYIFVQMTRQLTESLVWASTFQIRAIHSFFISTASILIFGLYGILLSPFFLLIAVKIKSRNLL